MGGWGKMSNSNRILKDFISAGSKHTVGLKSDGTVVAVGDNDHGQCDVGAWSDIRVKGHK